MKRRLLFIAGGLAVVLVALAVGLLVRRSEEETDKPGAAATLNAATTETQAVLVATSTPTMVALPTLATPPVPDDISAEELRQLAAAAAATVNDVTYESSRHTTTESRSGGSLSTTTVTGPPDSPTLNIGEAVDLLLVDDKRYWRASGGPWVTDADDPGAPHRQTHVFPYWYAYVSEPVGVPKSDAWIKPTGEVQRKWTATVTGLSVSGPTSGVTGRCWDLTVVNNQDSGGSSRTHENTFTVCEPSFLVVKQTENVSVDNFRYDTGVDLNAPDQVTVVHCGGSLGEAGYYACLFGR